MRQAVHAKYAELLYVPPYSLDLNAIELLFAKLKSPPRKAAERSIAAPWTRIGELLDQVSDDECRYYLEKRRVGDCASDTPPRETRP